MALDLATARFLEEIAKEDRRPADGNTSQAARAFASWIAELAGPAPAMERVEERVAKGPDGEAKLRILVPVERPRGVLVQQPCENAILQPLAVIPAKAGIQGLRQGYVWQN